MHPVLLFYVEDAATMEERNHQHLLDPADQLKREIHEYRPGVRDRHRPLHEKPRGMVNACRQRTLLPT